MDFSVRQHVHAGYLRSGKFESDARQVALVDIKGNFVHYLIISIEFTPYGLFTYEPEIIC